jgi:uncharacterized damage-inducible protein DinB
MSTNSTISVPSPDEYAGNFANYISRVNGEVFAFMDATHAALHALLKDVSEAQAEARPAPGEWSIKEVIGHISDTERIFAYRALRFARNDATPLPGFDQDPYVPAGEFNMRSLRNVLAELDTVRAASLSLFQNMREDASMRRGTASTITISARALLFAIAGHEDHHLESLRTVYLGK